jgi:hypothetical protein
VLPRLHSGRVDCLRLVHQVMLQRWVLRLWPSDFEIAGTNIPLLVGTIEVQHRRRLTWLITAAGDTGEYDRPREALIQMLRDRFALKSVSRTTDEIQVSRAHRRLHWDGEVLLVWKKED